MAVTGVRQLTESDALGSAIADALQRIRVELFDAKSHAILASSPNTPIAFSVLTALGEGAERVLARQILRAGGRLDVILPVPEEEYLLELPSDDSRNEFKELALHARWIRYLRRKTHFGAATGATRRRARADEELCRALVQHCDVVLAVVAEADPSTPAMVRRILQEADADGRPVVIISPLAPHAVDVRKGNGLSAQAVKWLERYNAAPLPQPHEQLLVHTDNVPVAVVDAVRDVLEPAFARAERMAMRSQSVYRWAGRIVYFLSPVAVASVASAILFHNAHPWGYYIELVLLLVILGAISYAHCSRSRKTWMGARVLAERLRSAVFLAVAGVEPSSIPIPPYMGMAHEPNYWMNRAFDEIWSRMPSPVASSASVVRDLAAVVESDWLADQRRFHRKKINEAEWKGLTLENAGWWVFRAALIVSSAHLLLPCLPHEWMAESSLQRAEEFLGVFALMLPAAGASVGGLRAHREYARLARRSEEMNAALGKLERQYKTVATPEEFKALVRQTEEVMLSETQGWLMLMGGVRLSA